MLEVLSRSDSRVRMITWRCTDRNRS